MIGKRFRVPYRRLVPIWRYGPRYNLFGERVADGWYCDKYGEWTFSTQAEADKAVSERRGRP